MKRTSVRWRIFKYNLIVILMLLALTTVIFNIAVGRYFERSITGQMARIADRTEELALLKGPEFFPPHDSLFPPPDAPEQGLAGNPLFRDVTLFYFMLDRSLREPLSVLDAEYILLDMAGERVTGPWDQFFRIPERLEGHLKTLAKAEGMAQDSIIFTIDGEKYVAVFKPVSDKNTFGLGWVILYSSLGKVHQIQQAMNVILFAILVFSAGITVLFSSHTAHLVCAPFAQLDKHIRILADRKFGEQLTLPVDEELQGLVNTINGLSEMLEKHDDAQKTFLQNVSHEFRTPLMTIQSHAEGICHQVIGPRPAAEIILIETQRLTALVENLLYLSRLDALEEVYEFQALELNALADQCAQRMQSVAEQAGISLKTVYSPEMLWVFGDDENLCCAVNNLIANGIRHARETVTLTVVAGDAGQGIVKVQDDGEGVDPEDVSRLFDRFYRGRNGKSGLGLAIVKAVISRHRGSVSVEKGIPGAVFLLNLPLYEERSS